MLVPGAPAGAARTSEPFIRALPYARRRTRATVSTEADYRSLCRQVETKERAGRAQDRRPTAGERRVRSAAARRAVLLRSRGRCENPDCFKADLPYRTKAGEPLLEADHIDDHAKGGRDHPAAMIALCPNCHRNKTHGEDGPAMTERLRAEAALLDTKWQEHRDPRWPPRSVTALAGAVPPRF
ncbi:HNH endonuclease [Streptomyces katsurahamanus]|uniref:HNH endonuclease n=1 Tax=Streptomyces katsurahamanus TaxID=2577098 RepID=A0ABW9NWR3_9ACTN|nr:HNH endonuclease [Streptomyces katsurahamanus]